MHKNGWRPFWAALGAALLVLLPLVGGTVLLTRQMVRTRIQTAQPQSGVPIQLPRAEHRMTLLLCTAGEQPSFLLVYLNAAQNSLNLLAVPGELTVPFNEETAGLAHCYGAAGPVRRFWRCWACRRICFIWRCPPPCWKRLLPVTGRCGWGFRGH
jgi:hypothetical protein